MTYEEISPRSEPAGQRLVLVTGPSGSGRTTALGALEDLGFETISNMPLSLVPRLLDGPPLDRPVALGIDTRTRDFSTAAAIELIDGLTGRPGVTLELVFLDTRSEVLLRRYSESRRRHPLTPSGAPETGIAEEGRLLQPIRARADVLIDTSDMSPHELRAEMSRWFAVAGQGRLVVSLHSFAYKRGAPRGLDFMFDCRFLRNPHWVPALRDKDGCAPEVAAYIAEDPRHAPFLAQLRALMDLVLPAQVDEGKSHVAIGFGCTGGQHRSVAVTERIAAELAEAGWQVSKRHRELERRADPGGAQQEQGSGA